jgi:hypothetical protein
MYLRNDDSHLCDVPGCSFKYGSLPLRGVPDWCPLDTPQTAGFVEAGTHLTTAAAQNSESQAVG